MKRSEATNHLLSEMRLNGPLRTDGVGTLVVPWQQESLWPPILDKRRVNAKRIFGHIARQPFRLRGERPYFGLHERRIPIMTIQPDKPTENKAITAPREGSNASKTKWSDNYDIQQNIELWCKAKGVKSRFQLSQMLTICHANGIDPMMNTIVLIDGKPYITRHGLQSIARKNGVRSIIPQFCKDLSDTPNNLFVFRAEVTTRDGGVFVAYGDAGPDSVSGKHMTPHLRRVAETRAVNRAITAAYNPGLISVEELGGSPLPFDSDLPAISLPASRKSAINEPIATPVITARSTDAVQNGVVLDAHEAAKEPVRLEDVIAAVEPAITVHAAEIEPTPSNVAKFSVVKQFGQVINEVLNSISENEQKKVTLKDLSDEEREALLLQFANISPEDFREVASKLKEGSPEAFA